VTDINQAIIDITTPHAEQLRSAAWSQTSMELYLSALEQGQLMDFKGASGEIRFDNETYTSAIHTTYVHWQIHDGKIQHRNYLSSDGSHRTSSTMAAWSWLAKNAEEAFARSAENKDAGISYPALTAQYAVLVQGSNGWNNYRHQADVLSVYQMLKTKGFDDDHIILIIDKALASDAMNPEPGIIRAEDGGNDLLAGCSMDYDNADISPSDISNILLGVKTDKTPVVLPKDAGQNVLLFWSGHGHNHANNGANELVWRNADVGRGMTADLLRQTISLMHQQGQYRKMFVLTEPCFSEAVITPLVGIPGVLAMSSAGTFEQSFADNWSTELGVWRCDRFSRNLVTHLTASPTTTYRDLYLFCAQRTLGSHVHIVNSAHFGNLYTTGPQEFFEK
jgi:glycosylphosphatidylinositol transamidase (GPIT) subunit GPI8